MFTGILTPRFSHACLDSEKSGALWENPRKHIQTLYRKARSEVWTRNLVVATTLTTLTPRRPQQTQKFFLSPQLLLYRISDLFKSFQIQEVKELRQEEASCYILWKSGRNMFILFYFLTAVIGSTFGALHPVFSFLE